MKSLLFLCLILLLSCQKTEDIRQYQEISGTDKKKVEVPEQTASAFSWVTPSEWIEEKGQSMRLASFHPKEGNSAFLITLLQLPSNGGGIQANVERWAGQLKMNLSPSAIQAFIADGIKVSLVHDVQGIILDFSTLETSPESSMLTAILQKPGLTLFVKMTATQAVLKQERPRFDAFVQSLTLIQEKK